jgi:murein DD-endopeptidase MepM/ murein hydrolase activator NlpD
VLVVQGALLVLAAAYTFPRTRGHPAWPRGRRAALGLAARATLAALAASLAMYAYAARRTPGDTLGLAPPLAGGTYLVANGGSLELLNSHLMTLQGERFRPYRGQSHALDLVRVRAGGVRARGVAPPDPADYLIFGDTVLAPCDGEVVVAADGLPDMRARRPDREHMAGNHVVVRCGPAWVVLAHLRRGSVAVQPGDRVKAGDAVGLVGNSGNTMEPHLHVHAQRPGTDRAPLGGEPLPIRIDGRYLVRNQRVTWTRGVAGGDP